MAQYWTDFSEYTLDAQPSDWTKRLVTTNNSVLVKSLAAASNGVALEIFGVTGTGRRAVSWDALDADPLLADVEILWKWRSSSTSGMQLRSMARMSGTSDGADNNGYLLGVDAVSTSGNRLAKYVAGTLVNISSDTKSHSSSTWYWTRARVNGSSLKLRTWDATNVEPGTWDLEATDTDVSAAGWVGLFNFGSSSTYHVDIFAAATGGESASMTDPGGGGDTTAPTLTSPTGSASGTTTASGSVSTNEATGTLYWLASANASESVATVKAGSSQSVTATGVQNVSVTGLTAATTYYLHFVHTDAASNDSAVSTSASFTTNAAASPKLRVDQLIYDDAAGTAPTTLSGLKLIVLTRDASAAIAYQTSTGSIASGVLEITDAAFETAAQTFNVVVIASATVRGVFPATVVVA